MSIIEELRERIKSQDNSIALDHINSYLIGSETPNILFLRAIYFRRIHEYEKAKRDLDMALELDPYVQIDKTSGYEIRARVNGALRKFENSVNDFSNAIEMHKDKYILYKLRSLSHICLKNYEEALADINTAIDLNKTDYHSYYQRSRIYYYLAKDNNNQMSKALEDINRAIEMKQDDYDLFFLRSRIYFLYQDQNKDYLPNAFLDINKAIKLNSTNNDLHYLKGIIYYRMKHYDMAIDTFTYVIKHEPKKADAYLWRSRCFARENRWRKAKDELMRAMKYDENIWSRFINLDYYVHQGRDARIRTEVEQEYNEAQQLRGRKDPNWEDDRDATGSWGLAIKVLEGDV